MEEISKLFKAALYNEVKACVFYNKAAESANDNESRMLFIELSSMEDDHSLFLINKFSNSPFAQGFNPDAYVKALQSSLEKIFSGDELKTMQTGDIREFLEMAVSMEKVSQKNYLNLAELIEDSEAKDFCIDLAKEEEKHANLLVNQLHSLDMDEDERPSL